MKIIMLLLAALLFLASCGKEYTCTCNYNGGTQEIKLVSTIKKDAIRYCDDQNVFYQQQGTGGCSLDEQ